MGFPPPVSPTLPLFAARFLPPWVFESLHSFFPTMGFFWPHMLRFPYLWGSMLYIGPPYSIGDILGVSDVILDMFARKEHCHVVNTTWTLETCKTLEIGTNRSCPVTLQHNSALFPFVLCSEAEHFDQSPLPFYNGVPTDDGTGRQLHAVCVA